MHVPPPRNNIATIHLSKMIHNKCNAHGLFNEKDKLTDHRAWNITARILLLSVMDIARIPSEKND